MRLLYIHYGPFDCNSAIQAFHFANLLSELGWEVVLCANGEPEEIKRVGKPQFECIGYKALDRKLAEMEQNPAETILCAWTPRERVRRLTLEAARRLNAPYVVHLEDNEEHLLSTATGKPIAELRRHLAPSERDGFSATLVHPTRYLDFLRGAAGVTVITEELSEFNVGSRPWRVVRPGVDIDRFRPDVEPPPRAELGLADDDFVLVYHGVMHYANQHEMLSLYLAVKLLQRRGRQVRLVRLGDSGFGGPDPYSFRALADGVIEMGPVPWREVPPYLALADAYVQPGAADDFNRYRLPSKLPEFLAMSRPVVLPRCNIGGELEDGRNALLLERGDAIEIADRVEELIDNPELAESLGREARRFAVEKLDWATSAMQLGAFLERALKPSLPT